MKYLFTLTFLILTFIASTQPLEEKSYYPHFAIQHLNPTQNIWLLDSVEYLNSYNHFSTMSFDYDNLYRLVMEKETDHTFLSEYIGIYSYQSQNQLKLYNSSIHSLTSNYSMPQDSIQYEFIGDTIRTRHHYNDGHHCSWCINISISDEIYVNGLLEETRYFSWNNNYREDYIYNIAQKLLEKEKYILDANDNWVLNRRDVYTYNAQWQPINILAYNAAGLVIQKDFFTYNTQGQLISDSTSHPNVSIAINPSKRTYTYDSTNQLVAKIFYRTILNIPTKVREEFYQYDINGNLSSKTLNYYQADTLNGSGHWDYYYIPKFLTTTHTVEKSNIEIYPNPTTDVLNFSENIDIQNIKITDVQGKIVFWQTKNIGNQIHIGHLSKGLYFLTLTTNDGKSETIQVLKQ